MAYAFFKVPCTPEPGAADLLNDFLRRHSVLAVEKQWVGSGEASFWAFCVQYHEGPVEPKKGGGGGGGVVDYRQVLPPEQFEIYARLRSLRKTLADRDGVPVFAVFSNEQLAEMARKPLDSLADLKAIAGIGPSRADKYGAEILAERNREAHAADETPL